MSRTEVLAPTKPSGIPWLGEVPTHWEVKRIKSVVVRSENGAWGEDEAGDENDVFCYRAADFDTDRMLVTAEKLVRRNVTPDVFRRKAVRPEHLLIEKSGGGENVPVGRVVRSLLDEPAVFSNFLGLIEVDEAQADSNFMRYTFWHLYSGKVPWRSIKQTTGLQNLDTSSYFDERIALPPLPEQRAIAAFLDERTARIDALVARKRRLVQLLKEKRQALITRAVTRGLDPQAKMKESGVPWLGEVPEGWEVVPLRHIAESIQTGPFGSQLHEADYVEGGIPLINPAHMIQGGIVPEAESAVDEATKERLARYVLDAGDILFARRGEIGRCALVADHQAGWMCGTGSMRLRLADSDPDYYAILFGSRGFAEALELNAVGTTMLNINPTILARQFVPRPPRTEQTEIREYVASTTARIDALVTKVEAAVERLQEYRTALISAAVTGKVQMPIGRSEDQMIRQ